MPTQERPQPPLHMQKNEAPTSTVAAPENVESEGLEPIPLSRTNDMSMSPPGAVSDSLEPVQLLSHDDQRQPITAMKTTAEKPQNVAEMVAIEPQPKVMKTKIIMPEDAPQKALEHTEGSTKLSINPYPEGKSAPAPAPSAPTLDVMAPIPSAEMVAKPMAPVEQPVEQKAEMKMAAKSPETVLGFGTDMPLALALSQVVPPHYSYSFATNINPGQRVSWNGGKPWEVVVMEMASSAGLKAVIGSDSVHIKAQKKN